ncbi:LRP2 [Mytilus edulis]|uniref:LRP2 n=1 Tax=Mytilus edulis TaxID=6550 RepID=A0A8S3UUC3_MYTED|nr:unnamed protein product [Mytilus edulis]CAG2249126.1 LRP2 [Mytilus edulis]
MKGNSVSDQGQMRIAIFKQYMELLHEHICLGQEKMNYLPLTIFVIGFCTNLSLSVAENNCEKCKDNVQCIPWGGLCNGHVHCDDQSDEDPEFCREFSCSSGAVKCKNNIECVRRGYLCDGYKDCNDESDEDPEMCKDFQCPSGFMKCRNNLNVFQLSSFVLEQRMPSVTIGPILTQSFVEISAVQVGL